MPGIRFRVALLVGKRELVLLLAMPALARLLLLLLPHLLLLLLLLEKLLPLHGATARQRHFCRVMSSLVMFNS